MIKKKAKPRDMPTDPKELAKAMFRTADEKFTGFPTKFQRQSKSKT